MPSVSSVCLAYDERMSNVSSIRSHTLKIFEHVKKIFLLLHITTYTDVCQRMRNVHDVCLTYPNVYLHIRAYDHTLAYADVIRCRVTPLLNVNLAYCFVNKTIICLMWPNRLENRQDGNTVYHCMPQVQTGAGCR